MHSSQSTGELPVCEEPVYPSHQTPSQPSAISQADVTYPRGIPTPWHPLSEVLKDVAGSLCNTNFLARASSLMRCSPGADEGK